MIFSLDFSKTKVLYMNNKEKEEKGKERKEDEKEKSIYK